MTTVRSLKNVQLGTKTVQAESNLKVKDEEILESTQYLYSGYDAGKPINSILREMEQATPNKRLATVWGIMAEDIENGKVLSESMLRFPKVFGEDYRALIRAAELSGNWTKRRDRNGEMRDGILDMLMRYIKRRNGTREKVKSGLIYPAFIGVFSLAVVMVFAFYIVPSMKQMFDELGMKDPGMLTRMMFWFMEIVQKYWYAFPIVGAIGGFILWDYSRSIQGKEFWMKTQLKLPVVGKIFTQLNLAEMFWLAGCLFSAGLTPQEVLDVLIDCVRNSDISEGLKRAKEYFHQGINFSEALRKGHPIFDGYPFMVLSGAQKTGRLGIALQNYAEQLFEKVDYSIDRSVKLIEPVMIVFVGVIVGLMVISYYGGLSNLIGNIATSH
jgi:type IV pilus assembly protein PilC